MILCGAACSLTLASPASALEWRADFAVPAIAGDPREQRVDLFDLNSNRQGYAVISAHGRIDTYDQLSNHIGTGRLSPDGRTIELFDLHGRRIGTGRLGR